MSNWKDMIKQRVELHIQRDEDIQKAISSLILELKEEPYKLKADFEKTDRINSIWRILIEQKTFEITEQEISKAQGISPTHQEPTKELQDAIIEIILDKFHY